MSVVKVQKVKSTTSPVSYEDTLARFCYHFPAYKYNEARRMPHRRIMKMLKIAQQEYAKNMNDMLRVCVAPHTKGGKGVKKAVEYFQSLVD